MFHFYSLLFLYSVPLLVSAGRLACSKACLEALSDLNFTATDASASSYVSECQNEIHVQSIFICMREYCTPPDLKAGLVYYGETCIGDGSKAMPYSIVATTNETEIQSLPRTRIANYTSSALITTPVFVSPDLYDLAKRSVDARDTAKIVRANYGYAMFGFWAFVLFIGTLSRVLATVGDLRWRIPASRTNLSQGNVLPKIQLWTKYWITTPALISHHTAEPVGWCTVPPRLQSFTIGAFVLINIILCCISYDLFKGNLYWPETQTQLARYLADRAGVLAIANLPLLWTFAMRNNVLMWLTNWNFSTFNMFHRWVARVATLEAMIHAIAYTVEVVLIGGEKSYHAHLVKRYWWCGIMGVVAMAFLCALSAYPIRARIYEAFLAIHIALAGFLMVVLWYHVEVMDGEYNGYIWPCVAVWAFDRVARVVRLTYLNFPHKPAVLSYNSEAGVVRVECPVPNSFRPRPGTYYYIYVLQGYKFWESHPFTLSSWCSGHIDDLTPCEKVEKSDTNKIVSFIIRPLDSFTDRLRKSILLQQRPQSSIIGSITSHRVLIEGPYGHHVDLAHYGSILLVVGGTGITVALSHLCELYSHDHKEIPMVRLMWVVRDIALVQDVYERELEHWLTSPVVRDRVRLELEVYVTTGSTSPKAKDCSADSSGSTSPIEKEVDVLARHDLPTNGLNSDSRIAVLYRRPDVLQVVKATVNRHAFEGGIGRLAVVSCGPPQMADDTRAAVVKMLGDGHAELDYFPESFSW